MTSDDERKSIPRHPIIVRLSLAIYLIGLVWVAKIAILDSGLDALFGVILITIVCMVSSIALAILASLTYPRAFAMLIVHALTIAFLFSAHWASGG